MSLALSEPPTVEPRNSARPMRRLLLIAYNFPPVGGAGVQRPVKWVKYLRRFGWDVTVLTVLNPSVPVRDESLLLGLPDDLKIVKARTWEPDYRVKQQLINSATTGRQSLVQKLKGSIRSTLRYGAKFALQPDSQILWNHHATRAGVRILSEQRHDAILATAPPYSSFFIGSTLKRRFNIPLILDFRDEWDLSGKYLENAQHDSFSRWIQERMQRRLLRQADGVIATTGRSVDALAEKLHRLGHMIPHECIYNGFDADDFSTAHEPDSANSSDVTKPEKGTFRLVYTGTLWNLTDIAPLVRGIETLNATQPELVRKLEFVCVGRKTPDQQVILDRLSQTSVRLKSIDYCEHTTALQWLRSASGVCLLLSDVPGAERVVPAKMFEYLAVRKEILTIAPSGETADIIRRFFPEGHFHSNEASKIAEWLAKRLSGSQPEWTAENSNCNFQEFSRESQTGRLADLLNDLVTKGN